MRVSFALSAHLVAFLLAGSFGFVACVGDTPAAPLPDGGTDGGDAGGPEAGGDGGVDAGPPAATATHQWVKLLGGQTASGIATDAQGNSYVTGQFSGAQIDFEKTKLSSSGSTDIYVMKLDPKGVVTWVVAFGGTLDDQAEAIAVDDAGDVYLSGNFRSTTLTIGNTIALAGGGGTRAGFVAKIKGADGTGQWAAVMGGGSTYCPKLAAGAGIVAAGCRYDGGTFANPKATLTSFGSSDGAVVAFDPSGTVKWATGIGSGSVDSVDAVAVGPSGDILVMGAMYGTPLRFTSDTAAYAKKGAGYNDAFVTRLSFGEGKPSWGVIWGSSSQGNVFPGVAATRSNDLAIGGIFYGGGDLGVGGATPTVGQTDSFVVKFDVAAQKTTWAKTVGGTDTNGTYSENTVGVAVDPWGDVIAVGLTDTADCKADGNVIPGPADGLGYGMWAVKYAPSGTVLWAKGIPPVGSGDRVYVAGVAAAPNGDVRIVGTLNGSAKLDRTNVVASNGSVQMFVMGWSP